MNYSLNVKCRQILGGNEKKMHNYKISLCLYKKKTLNMAVDKLHPNLFWIILFMQLNQLWFMCSTMKPTIGQLLWEHFFLSKCSTSFTILHIKNCHYFSTKKSGQCWISWKTLFLSLQLKFLKFHFTTYHSKIDFFNYNYNFSLWKYIF